MLGVEIFYSYMWQMHVEKTSLSKIDKSLQEDIWMEKKGK